MTSFNVSVLSWRGRALAVAVVVLSLVASLSGPVGSATAQESDHKAVEHVSQEHGIPADQLSVIESGSSEFPLTRVETEDYKVLSAEDGQTYAVSFAAGSEDVVDHGEAAGAEAQERERRNGKASPALAERARRSPNARIPVAVWTRMDNAATIGRARTEAAYNEVEERARNARAGAAAEARGFGPQAQVAEAEGSPVVFAHLTAGQINGLSRRPDVVSIEEIPAVAPHIDDSATSGRFMYRWPYFRGYGAVVAVHEGGGVDNVHPDLNNATHPVEYWSDTQGIARNIDQHPTNVAGVIASTNPWRRGGAYGASRILSANFPGYSAPTEQFVASAMWAVRSNAAVINMSWGTVCSGGNTDFFSRWVDYVVHTYGASIVSSSGNSSCPSGTPQYVGSPSLGWNTVSVGSYYDNGNGLLADDALSSFSSFANPTDPVSGGTYEKPDLVAMGGQVAGGSCFGVETTNVGGGFNTTCGTSFSSPDTAALATNILGRSNVQARGLAQNAETVKAILMAGARHNIIDGVNLRSCPSSPIANDCRDGAGAINADQAFEIYLANAYDTIGHVTPASWPSGPAGDKHYPVNLTNGVPFRGVLAWNSSADCIRLGTSVQECTSDVLNADLDLHLFDPAGNVVASAASVRNSAEVIDYTPPATGTYTLRARNFAFQANTSTYAGVAWDTDTRDTRHPLTSQGVIGSNGTIGGQTTNRMASYWDTYGGPDASCVSFMNTSTGLERVFRVQVTQTGSLTASLSQIAALPGAGSDLDVAILQRPSGVTNENLNQHMVACGDSSATAANLAPGFYWVVVDGFAGSVAGFRLTTQFVAASAAAAPSPEPLPDRS